MSIPLKLKVVLGLALLSSALASIAASPGAGAERFFIGTYTSGTSRGIYQSSLDLGTGVLGTTNLATVATDPSFLALHPNRRFLYAVNESGGYVVSFAVETDTGTLHLLNQRSSSGSGPCHLVTDKAGRNVLVANYGGGGVTVLPIQADGRLGPFTSHIQHPGTGPLAHCVTLSLLPRVGQNQLVTDRMTGFR